MSRQVFRFLAFVYNQVLQSSYFLIRLPRLAHFPTNTTGEIDGHYTLNSFHSKRSINQRIVKRKVLFSVSYAVLCVNLITTITYTVLLIPLAVTRPVQSV